MCNASEVTVFFFGLLYSVTSTPYSRQLIEKIHYAASEINISPVPDIVSGSQQFVQVTRRSSVYDILLKYENLPVIVTDRKRILSVTREIVPDSDR